MIDDAKLTSLTSLMYGMETQSDDPHTQVGCVISDRDGNVVLTGANALTSGVNAAPEMLERPEKYDWIEHAERNTIFRAARTGVPLEGKVMHLPGFPCVECARSIAQSGISVLHHGSYEGWDEKRYKFSKSLRILRDAGVELVERKAP